jgi:hypothetical protein
LPEVDGEEPDDWASWDPPWENLAPRERVFVGQALTDFERVSMPEREPTSLQMTLEGRLLDWPVYAKSEAASSVDEEEGAPCPSDVPATVVYIARGAYDDLVAETALEEQADRAVQTGGDPYELLPGAGESGSHAPPEDRARGGSTSRIAAEDGYPGYLATLATAPARLPWLPLRPGYPGYPGYRSGPATLATLATAPAPGYPRAAGSEWPR